jgi:hypothetical protein
VSALKPLVERALLGLRCSAGACAGATAWASPTAISATRLTTSQTTQPSQVTRSHQIRVVEQWPVPGSNQRYLGLHGLRPPATRFRWSLRSRLRFRRRSPRGLEVPRCVFISGQRSLTCGAPSVPSWRPRNLRLAGEQSQGAPISRSLWAPTCPALPMFVGSVPVTPKGALGRPVIRIVPLVDGTSEGAMRVVL